MKDVVFRRNYFEQNSWDFIFSSKCNILGTLILAKPCWFASHRTFFHMIHLCCLFVWVCFIWNKTFYKNINLFVKLIKRCCWFFLNIVDPGDLYDINPAFCTPADNSPCIKYTCQKFLSYHLTSWTGRAVAVNYIGLLYP